MGLNQKCSFVKTYQVLRITEILKLILMQKHLKVKNNFEAITYKNFSNEYALYI